MPAKAGSGDAPRLRPLLPAVDRPSSCISKPTTNRLKPSPRARPSVVSGACVDCRKLKLKCSGERPSCRRCNERSLECTYTTRPGETERQARDRRHHNLQKRTTNSEQLLKLFVDLPLQDAQDLLQRLRSGADIESIMKQVHDCDLLLQMKVLPEARFRYSFPYRSEMPEHCTINNPYLDSLVYEATSLYSGSRPMQEVVNHPILSTTWQQDLYLKPFHAAEVVDPLLTNVKLSAWTTVCDDDRLMQDILNYWLRCEYQFTAAFQKDLFLEDLATKRGDFCSSLLVNIILGYACVCYPKFSARAKYWDPSSLTYRFLAEARRLWELNSHIPHITTIQTGILFSVYYNLCGLDEVGQAYRIQAVTLAKVMRLFDHTVEAESLRKHHGRTFTAWALFNWETLVGFSFTFSPLLVDPPPWPLPDPAEHSAWYGEIWLQYPLGAQRVPSFFGHMLRARSQFRMIMNEACQSAYGGDPGIDASMATALYAKLQDWYSGLPIQLQPKSIVLPSQLQLHLYYYHLILTIFEPLLSTENDEASVAGSIIAKAKMHLQTLVRLYYLRHGYEAMDLFIVIPLMLVASDCIDIINEQTSSEALETLRSTLILVAKGLSDQRKNHYLANALFRVIQGRMRPSELALYRGVLSLNEETMDDELDMVQQVRSHWPVSVVKKKEEKEGLILTNLVEEYGHLNIS